MPDANDMDLVRDFARENSEAAFAELVQRHINLVYSVGLRCTGSSADAQDVTQAVFLILAQKAAGLRERTVLTGWLYETTRFASAKFLRTKARRATHEQEAYMQSTLNQPDTEGIWRLLAPHLEDAMSRLAERDRTLLALRFYENKTGAAAAAALGIGEDAAHKRTARALEKLRTFFSKRGVTLTAALIAGAVAANSVQAAPAGLAATVTAAAAKGTAVSGSILTLIKGALKIMAWSKAKTTIVAVVTVLMTIGITTVVVEKIIYPNSWADDPKYWETDSSALGQVPTGVFIFRPTRFPKTGGLVWVGDRVSAKNCFVSEVVNVAYGFSHARTILPPVMPRGNFDVMSTMPGGSATPLKDELQKRFHVTAHTETRPADVLVLKVQNPNPPNLNPHNGDAGNSSWVAGNRKTTIRNQQFSGLVYDIESRIGRPVIDETGLVGKYDFEIQWQPRAGESDKDAYVRFLREQLGLELVPSREKIEILVVEKVK